MIQYLSTITQKWFPILILDTRFAYSVVTLCGVIFMYRFARKVFPSDPWAHFFSLGLAFSCLGFLFATLELIISAETSVPFQVVLARFLFLAPAPYLIYIGGRAFIDPPVFDRERLGLWGYIRHEFPTGWTARIFPTTMISLPLLYLLLSPLYFQFPVWHSGLYGCFFFGVLIFFGICLMRGQSKGRSRWIVFGAALLFGAAGLFYGLGPFLAKNFGDTGVEGQIYANTALTGLLMGELILFFVVFLVLQRSVQSWIPSEQGAHDHLEDFLTGIQQMLDGGSGWLLLRVPGQPGARLIASQGQEEVSFDTGDYEAEGQIFSGQVTFLSFIDAQGHRRISYPISHKGGVIACLSCCWSDGRVVTANTWRRVQHWGDLLGPLIHAQRQQLALTSIAQDIEDYDSSNLARCDEQGFLNEYAEAMMGILLRRLSPVGVSLSWDLGYHFVPVTSGDLATDLVQISGERLTFEAAGTIDIQYSLAGEQDQPGAPCLVREAGVRTEVGKRVSWALANVVRSRFQKIRKNMFAAFADISYSRPEKWLEVLRVNLNTLENIAWVAAVLPHNKVWQDYHLRIEGDKEVRSEQPDLLTFRASSDGRYFLVSCGDLERLVPFAQSQLPFAGAGLLTVDGLPAAGFELENGAVIWVGLKKALTSDQDTSWLELFKNVSQAAAPALLRIESWLRNLELQDLNGKIRRRNMSSMDMHSFRGQLAALDSGFGLAEDLTHHVAAEYREMYQTNLANLKEVKEAMLGMVTRIAKSRHVADRETDLAQVFEFLLESESPKCVMKGIRLELAIVESLVVAVSFDIVFAAVQELVSNAIKAMDDGGVIDVSVGMEDGRAWCLVQDNGPGVDPAIAERVFELGVSTSPDGGLGLNAVRRELRREHGDICLVQSQRGATLFKVSLPLAADANG